MTTNADFVDLFDELCWLTKKFSVNLTETRQHLQWAEDDVAGTLTKGLAPLEIATRIVLPERFPVWTNDLDRLKGIVIELTERVMPLEGEKTT